VAGAVRLQIEGCRPAAQSVDRLRAGHAGAEHHDRRDAAKVGEVALEHVERDARRDPGIDRAPAAREHPQARERGEVVARAHHVLRPQQCRAPLVHPDRWCGVLDRDLTHAETLSPMCRMFPEASDPPGAPAYPRA